VTGTWYSDVTGDFPRITLKTKSYALSFRKLDENHIHPLDSNGNLLNGDGGWSFTLNKVGGVIEKTSAKRNVTGPATKESFASKTFHGRTPCQEISKDAGIISTPDCFKLKWLLRLYQDSTTQVPTHYELKRTFHRQSIISGKWKIYTASINGREEIVYELDPDKPQSSIRLMKGDNNVLFFLDHNLNFLPGGEEFGYTLNSR
jgi:hypothetical protein